MLVPFDNDKDFSRLCLKNILYVITEEIMELNSGKIEFAEKLDSLAHSAIDISEELRYLNDEQQEDKDED